MLSIFLSKRSILTRNISTFSKVLDKKKYDQNIKYTETEEWLYYHQDYIKMGLTKKAIDEMGELVYLEFPCKKGDVVKENEELVNIESVKTVESINAPYDCVILGTNNKLTEPDMNLDTINKTPECMGDSWIIKIDKIP